MEAAPAGQGNAAPAATAPPKGRPPSQLAPLAPRAPPASLGGEQSSGGPDHVAAGGSAVTSTTPQLTTDAGSLSGRDAAPVSARGDKGALVLPSNSETDPSELTNGTDTFEAAIAQADGAKGAPAEGSPSPGVSPTAPDDAIASAMARASCAEKALEKSEAEVRRLRAQLHAAQLHAASNAAPTFPCDGDDLAAARAAGMDAEERAVKAEAEAVRLRCELEAFRTAMFANETAGSTTPPPEEEFAHASPGCCTRACDMLRAPYRRLISQLTRRGPRQKVVPHCSSGEAAPNTGGNLS